MSDEAARWRALYHESCKMGLEEVEKRSTAEAALEAARRENERLRSALGDITSAFDGLRPFPLVIEPVAADLVAKARAALGADNHPFGKPTEAK